MSTSRNALHSETRVSSSMTMMNDELLSKILTYNENKSKSTAYTYLLGQRIARRIRARRLGQRKNIWLR
jgi:hypothetical protein